MLFGLADFVFILLGPVVIGRIFGSSEAPAFVHMMRAANSLRILRTCRLFKGLRGLLKACEAFVVSLAWAPRRKGVFIDIIDVVNTFWLILDLRRWSCWWSSCPQPRL